MGLKCGIVGLPNVGKSTLFNALTRSSAARAENYPFCTIEPQTGEIAVPDARLEKIARITHSQHIIPARVAFVDIAGLVRGASRGEGLGNRFLANIREADAIIHVLRCFNSEDIAHVEGRVDPLKDAETVETELMLADLESLEKRIVPMRKQASKDKESISILALMEQALAALEEGKPVRSLLDTKEEEARKLLPQLNLLTSRPVVYVCNISENDAIKGNEYTEKVQEKAGKEGTHAILISAALEEELAQMKEEEALEFIEGAGLEEPGLNRLICAGFRALDMITYFTTGPKETRAWTIRQGTKAPAAAGVIHNDFERGFIRAQTMAYEDFISLGGEAGVKEAGKIRDEGKDYIVKDGDIMLFRFST